MSKRARKFLWTEKEKQVLWHHKFRANQAVVCKSNQQQFTSTRDKTEILGDGLICIFVDCFFFLSKKLSSSYLLWKKNICFKFTPLKQVWGDFKCRCVFILFSIKTFLSVILFLFFYTWGLSPVLGQTQRLYPNGKKTATKNKTRKYSQENWLLRTFRFRTYFSKRCSIIAVLEEKGRSLSLAILWKLHTHTSMYHGRTHTVLKISADCNQSISSVGIFLYEYSL